MNKTTKKDFEYFKKRCEHWMRFWNLAEYSIQFGHESDTDDTLAWINRDIEGMCVGFSLNKNWKGVKVTKSELDRSAFHEVIHLVLARMALAGKSRWMTVDEICREEEAVIRRMENCIWKNLQEKKK